METLLLNGRFATEDADLLFSKIFKVKTDFHHAKIETISQTAEEIQHSENRIKELEKQLEYIRTLLKDGQHKHVALHVKLTVEFCPDYFNK